MRAARRFADLRSERAADVEVDTELGGEAPAGFLDASDLSVDVETDQPRADVDSGQIDHLAVGADRDLGGAATDVDIHHGAVVTDRARHRARTVRRHDGLQIVAGRDRDHLAGLAREQFADRACIAAADGDTGQDQRAGVDLVGIGLGVLVLLLDKGAERLGVDGLTGRIGREQDVGLVEGLAGGDHVAAVEPLQHNAREHEMRSRRADIDTDAENDDLVLVDQRASRAREEDAPAYGFVRHACDHPFAS